MPINSDPSATIPFSLPADKDIPEATRPVFHLRFLTSRERREIAGWMRKAAAEEVTDEEAEPLLEQAILKGVAGWDRVTLRGESVDYGRQPGEFLSSIELWELAWATLRETRVKEKDLGESERPALSETASIAPTAVVLNV